MTLDTATQRSASLLWGSHFAGFCGLLSRNTNFGRNTVPPVRFIGGKQLSRGNEHEREPTTRDRSVVRSGRARRRSDAGSGRTTREPANKHTREAACGPAVAEPETH